jgi:hypothetical protein
MKTLLMLTMFISFITINAQAGEWVLWEYRYMLTISENQIALKERINQPVPLSEHKTLAECNNVSVNMGDAKFDKIVKKPNEYMKDGSHDRSTRPDGVSYQHKDGSKYQIEYRCFPSGLIPTKANFNQLY